MAVCHHLFRHLWAPRKELYHWGLVIQLDIRIVGIDVPHLGGTKATHVHILFNQSIVPDSISRRHYGDSPELFHIDIPITEK